MKEAKEGDNCRGSKKIRLVANTRAAATIPPGQSPPPAAAFSMSDGLDWGFVENADQDSAEAGDPVTVNLTAANGIPGQAGYTRTDTAPEAFRTGNATALDYSGSTNSGDDGQVTVPLPFAFPFGGIKEDKISVSTNGWVSFRSPAWDYWNDVQPEDYRGVRAVVGELERGIMPYWDDLDVREQGAGTGTVTEVVAPDNSWVAFQWDLGQHGGGTPRRTFQLVLFPDGSFRFDYPGKNETGGNEAFVGYSLGTGAGSADVVAENTESVPSTSLLFKPNALPPTGSADSGTVSTRLPKGSAFDSADSGCRLVSQPTTTSTGLVSCDVPSLAPGQQATRNVTYKMPPNAPGESSPANFRYLGTYTAGSVKLTDGDEVDALSTSLPATTTDVKTVYPGGVFEPGVPTNFEVSVKPKNGGLDEPSVELDLEGATFSSAKIAGEPIECTPPGDSSAICALPSGTHASKVEVTVVPTNSSSIDLEVTARALNAPDAIGGIGIINL